jgi:hypothetical protein
MKPQFVICYACIVLPSIAQPAGIFQKHTGVASPKIKGTTIYDKKAKTYTLSGGGYNIWFNLECSNQMTIDW